MTTRGVYRPSIRPTDRVTKPRTPRGLDDAQPESSNGGRPDLILRAGGDAIQNSEAVSRRNGWSVAVLRGVSTRRFLGMRFDGVVVRLDRRLNIPSASDRRGAREATRCGDEDEAGSRAVRLGKGAVRQRMRGQLPLRFPARDSRCRVGRRTVTMPDADSRRRRHRGTYARCWPLQAAGLPVRECSHREQPHAANDRRASRSVSRADVRTPL